MSRLKKKDVGDDNDSPEKGVDECGIRDRYVMRDERYLIQPAEILADKRTKAIIKYLDLPDYESCPEKARYDKIRNAVNEDLYEVFERQERGHLECMGCYLALFITFFVFTIIYFNVPCGLCFPPPPKPIDNCVCPIVHHPFNYTTKNLLNGEKENGTTNISMNVTFSTPDEIGPSNHTAYNTYREE